MVAKLSRQRSAPVLDANAPGEPVVAPGRDTALQASSKSSWQRHRFPAAIALGTLILDHLTKFWAVAALRDYDYATGKPVVIDVIPGLLAFRYAENTGAAFSMFSDYPILLTAITSVIALVLLGWYWKTPEGHRITRSALALVLGGAVGNLIDRFTRGSVVDFIDAYWRSYHWPTFNIADSAICIGIGILFLWAPREQKGR
jgi:signal peptidase II